MDDADELADDSNKKAYESTNTHGVYVSKLALNKETFEKWSHSFIEYYFDKVSEILEKSRNDEYSQEIIMKVWYF